MQTETSEALARCDREIAAMIQQEGDPPAWLATLGIEDWETEKRLIQREASCKRDYSS